MIMQNNTNVLVPTESAIRAQNSNERVITYPSAFSDFFIQSSSITVILKEISGRWRKVLCKRVCKVRVQSCPCSWRVTREMATYLNNAQKLFLFVKERIVKRHNAWMLQGSENSAITLVRLNVETTVSTLAFTFKIGNQLTLLLSVLLLWFLFSSLRQLGFFSAHKFWSKNDFHSDSSRWISKEAPGHIFWPCIPLSVHYPYLRNTDKVALTQDAAKQTPERMA